MTLITLVYVSVETQPFNKRDLLHLLEKARNKNRTLGITGMLLYRDGFFVQALEGEEDAVMSLYDIISQDSRHKNVLTIYHNSIQSRTFSDWTMGFNILSDEDLSQVEGYTGMLNAHFLADRPGRAVSLLESFRNRSYF